MNLVKKLLGVVLVVGVSISLVGCVVPVAIAVVSSLDGGGQTVTVEIEETPDTVYAAMLRVVADRSDVKLVKRDDGKFLVEAAKGKDKAIGQAILQNNGMTKLTVSATAGEQGQDSKQLALKIVETVCKELGVSYRVVDKK